MNTIGLIFRILNILLMLGIPCLAAVLVFRKGKYGFRPIWIGVLGFLLSQVGHLPFNQFLLLPGLRGVGIDPTAQTGISLIVLGLAAGFSAGIFEEGTRYLIFRYWLKERAELLPVKYAVGHGGIEAVLAGGLALIALIQVVVYSGDAALSSFSADQAQMIRSQLQAYWAVPGGQALLGAWERISSLMFHLGASLLVYKSVQERKLGWLLAALLGHAALDAFAVIYVQKMNLVLFEGLIFAVAALWVIGCWRVRVRDLPDRLEDLPEPVTLAQSTVQATSQQLDESRYDEN